MRKKAKLKLSTGQIIEGDLIGAPVQSSGELVFTTAMVGYSESITDPSYLGQMLVFAYPLIGNYGLPDIPNTTTEESADQLIRGLESGKVHLSGVIISSESNEVYHYSSESNLDSWLKKNNIPGIVNVDTRELVHLIRDNGEIFAKIIPEKTESYFEWPELEVKEKDFKEDEYFQPHSYNLMKTVSNKNVTTLGKGSTKVAVLNNGVKWNILRKVLSNDCQVLLLPWDHDLTSVECDAYLLSNGPGDPRALESSVKNIKKVLDLGKPTLGICLGNQLLALAAGADVEKLKFGHRGHNHPVYIEGGKKAFISSQNHGYVVNEKKLPSDWKVWFRNANDESVEGITHKEKPFWGVQFHPEASGGSNDTSWIIDNFISIVKEEGSRCQLDMI